MGVEVQGVCLQKSSEKNPNWNLSTLNTALSPWQHPFSILTYIFCSRVHQLEGKKAMAGFSLPWLWRPTPQSRCLQMWLSLHIWRALVGGQDVLFHSPNTIWVCSILINHPRKQDSWHFVGRKDLEELEKFLSSWWIRLFSSCAKLLTVERLDKIALD